MKVSHQHGGSFHIEDTLTAGFYLLLYGSSVDGKRRLGGAADRPGFGRTAGLMTLAIAVKRYSTILGVNCPVVAEKEVTSHEGTPALHALERALLGVCWEDCLVSQRVLGLKDDAW